MFTPTLLAMLLAASAPTPSSGFVLHHDAELRNAQASRSMEVYGYSYVDLWSTTEWNFRAETTWHDDDEPCEINQGVVTGGDIAWAVTDSLENVLYSGVYTYSTPISWDCYGIASGSYHHGAGPYHGLTWGIAHTTHWCSLCEDTLETEHSRFAYF